MQGLILTAELRRNFYIQLPPANNGRSPRAVGEPTSVLIPLIERARWGNPPGTWRGERRTILFHKHVMCSGFTLIGVKLIDGVGGEVNMREAGGEVGKAA